MKAISSTASCRLDDRMIPLTAGRQGDRSVYRAVSVEDAAEGEHAQRGHQDVDADVRDGEQEQVAEPNPYNSYPRIDLKRLEKERILLMKPEQRTRQIMDAYLRENGIHFDNVLYTGNLPAIMELVAQGYGVSFMFEPHLRHRLGTIPIDCYSFGEPKMVTDFVAATRKGAYLSTYARDFIEIARQMHANPQNR